MAAVLVSSRAVPAQAGLSSAKCQCQPTPRASPICQWEGGRFRNPMSPRCPGIGFDSPDPGQIGISESGIETPDPGGRPNRDRRPAGGRQIPKSRRGPKLGWGQNPEYFPDPGRLGIVIHIRENLIFATASLSTVKVHTASALPAAAGHG